MILVLQNDALGHGTRCRMRQAAAARNWLKDCARDTIFLTARSFLIAIPFVFLHICICIPNRMAAPLH
jgi:hypothetical protein